LGGGGMIDPRCDSDAARFKDFGKAIKRYRNRMRTFLDDEATVCCP
jgi:hypothetical protein